MKKERINTKKVTRVLSIVAVHICIAAALVFLPYSKGWCQEARNQPGENQLENSPAEESEKTIARVGKEAISEADLKEYLSYRPIFSGLAADKEAIEQRLDEMITNEALCQEAVRLGIDQEPDVRRAIQQILTQRLLYEKVEQYVLNREIQEDELQAYYDSHIQEFDRPEQARIADIFIVVHEKDSSEEIAEKKQKAKNILAEALEKGRYHFADLIQKYSDKHPNYPKGDTKYFAIDGLPIGLNSTLARAAFNLEKPGQIGKHLIETSEGYHVIMLSRKRPAYHKPIEEVKSLIEQRIRQEELERSREDFIQQVKQKADIKKNDRAVDEYFEKIKKTYGKNRQQGEGKSFRNMKTPPPFPGEAY